MTKLEVYNKNTTTGGGITHATIKYNSLGLHQPLP